MPVVRFNPMPKAPESILEHAFFPQESHLAIYELGDDGIIPLDETRFDVEGLMERGDLQRVLRDKIGAVAPGTMVIAEEFGGWDESKRRIDLLALDRSGNLVVIELKRTNDGGFMDLQALRYAAMVSAMTFAQAVEAHAHYLAGREKDAEASQAILDFLGWDEPNEDEFGQAVQIVLVAADFSKELTTSVLWLNEHDLDIRCVRVKPYTLDGRVLLDIQQVLPLPEAAEYQVKVKEKARREREHRRTGRDLTKYDVSINGKVVPRQAKRRTMFLVISELCRAGVSPEEIHRVLPWRGSGLWRVVDGEVSTEEFSARASEAAAAGGPAFDPRRWFMQEDELIRQGGRTWALSNGWGQRTEEGIRDLLSEFPGHEIVVTPSESE